MKRFFITTVLLTCLSAISMFALATDSDEAVSMISYEQGWLDSNGTIALRNNTSETIHDVTFMLEYLDMQDRPVDYETFTCDVEIAPGKTKKVDIPAYERSRHYQYYKTTKQSRSDYPKFKLRYEFKEYNSMAKELEAADELHTTHKDPSFLSELGFVLGMIIAFGVIVGVYALVAVMAQRRHRNAAAWVVVALFLSPILAAIILLIIGNNNNFPNIPNNMNYCR